MEENQVPIKKMITIKKAKTMIQKASQGLGEERINISNALGRVLSRSIKALTDNPPFDMSSMDGYAIKFSNQQQRNYTITGKIFAGSKKNYNVKDLNAIRIFTGASMPKGTNTVILQEEVIEKKGNKIEIIGKYKKNQYVRKKGRDFKKGDVLLKKNHIITARDIGLLISGGCSSLGVYKLPRIAIISTGDELALPGTKLKQGQVYASSMQIINNLLTTLGINKYKNIIVKDNLISLKRTFSSLTAFDLIISTGGISVGDKDLVLKALNSLNFKKFFWKVSIKPGKPMLFGLLNNKLFFGLPGNPVSTYVCFLIFIYESILIMSHKIKTRIGSKKAILLKDLRETSKRDAYLRGVADLNDSKLFVRALSDQDSSLLKNLALSNCLIKFPMSKTIIKKNELVEIIEFPSKF